MEGRQEGRKAVRQKGRKEFFLLKKLTKSMRRSWVDLIGIDNIFLNMRRSTLYALLHIILGGKKAENQNQVSCIIYVMQKIRMCICAHSSVVQLKKYLTCEGHFSFIWRTNEVSIFV